MSTVDMSISIFRIAQEKGLEAPHEIPKRIVDEKPIINEKLSKQKLQDQIIQTEAPRVIEEPRVEIINSSEQVFENKSNIFSEMLKMQFNPPPMY